MEFSGRRGYAVIGETLSCDSRTKKKEEKNSKGVAARDFFKAEEGRRPWLVSRGWVEKAKVPLYTPWRGAPATNWKNDGVRITRPTMTPTTGDGPRQTTPNHEYSVLQPGSRASPSRRQPMIHTALTRNSFCDVPPLPARNSWLV